MKFRPHPKPAPFLNRRDQFRLLGMIALLFLVIVSARWAARPSSWYWLIPPAAESAKPAPSLEDIDFRVKRDDQPAAVGTFRAVADEDNAELASLPEDGADVPEFPPELLATIEDNTLGLRRKEADAYYRMLSRVRDLPTSAANTRARDDIAFTVLMLDSDEYRGRLLTIRGNLRRLTELPSNPESGFDRLFEGWVFTSDSGTNPYRIVCLQIPEGCPRGELLDPPIPVRVTGYFFKRYGYQSNGGLHVAPMLVARTLERIPPASSVVAGGGELRNAMLGMVAIVLGGVLVLGVWFFVSDRRFQGSRLQRLAAARLDARPEDLAALQNVPTSDPERPFEPPNSDDASSPAGDPLREPPVS